MNNNQYPIVFVMIGLPCRGKSYWSKHLKTFMEYNQIEVKIFNLGEFRRKYQANNNEKAKFFNQDNKSTEEIRDQYAYMGLDNLKQYLDKNNNCIAIFDGTNTTTERRDLIRQELCNGQYIVIWVEMDSKDQQRIDMYIKNSKIFNADYQNSKMNNEERFKDFKKRIKSYEEVFIPFTNDEKELVKQDQYQHFLQIYEFGETIDRQLFEPKNDSLQLLDQFLKDLKKY